ncbi:YciI family protein [Helicobacter fennelliae]|uniref:YCII-related domain-containing protein n=2 Tax=Helicobacter fennelliae TaxID=215 RepID=T1DV87_9HELI|nr:YciI family protein [Helicobacter fennelliae]GAD18528.1 hypothetical protein HFN_2456 [Helicobacter fennelliae MRY12-0050]SQB97686.1 YCII-related protein [Helicobacter fennelliae]STP06914.1 YCII-related protein [Helicobacter fennelliae]
MQHLFIIEVKYQTSLEVVESHLANHRSFLQEWYKKGVLLASGPQNPKVGGMIIGRFESLDKAKEFTKQDPFYTHNIATYHFTEFDPVLHDECINNFLNHN